MSPHLSRASEAPAAASGRQAPPAEAAPPGELVHLVRALCTPPGVSGHEGDVAAVVRERLSAQGARMVTDPLGNLIAVCRSTAAGQGRTPVRIMLVAHMDAIGMLVSRIEPGGFLRLTPVGGVSLQTLPGQTVRVWTASGSLRGVVGLKPPHLTSREEMARLAGWEDLFVDPGLPEEAVRQRVRVGDVVVLEGEPVLLQGSRLAARALDNRAGLAAMVEAVRQLGRLYHQADVYAVATTQEEVGLRGATVSTYRVAPDVAIAVDVTFARQRGVEEPDGAEPGGGPVVAVGPNVHPRVRQRLLQVAREEGVPYQVEVIPGRSGTDAWAVQVSRAGVASGLVSIPLRYMHSPSEVVDLRDIYETGRLLAHFAASVDEAFVRSLSDWEMGVEVDGVRRDAALS